MRGIALVSLGIACGGGDRPPADPPTALEASIAATLAARYGIAIAVTCEPASAACTGRAPGIALPIRVTADGTAFDWRIDGLVVRASTIEDYVQTELAEVGRAQAVRCGARLHHVRPGERLVCDLAGGGKAFVTFGEDGASSFEIADDPTAGSARAESLTDVRERELLELSRQLADEPE